MSFLTDYFSIVTGATEAAVCCPFPHYTSNGTPYLEHNPSAHVNTENNLFHCKSCGKGLSEVQFMAQILGCSLIDAKKLQLAFNNTEDLEMWESSTTLTEESKQRALDLGISERVINELKLKTPPGSTDLILFPVFMYDHLIDIRTYDPGNKPKVRSRLNATSGLIIPYDLFRYSPKDKYTLICAGEKDMAIARTHGFKAITITGGENALPKTLELFRDRKIAICYDNDDAGLHGAKRLANKLLEYTTDIKIVTNFHEICKEKGEDITDFFVKYGKTREDLINYINNTPMYVPTEEDHNLVYPMMDLLNASQPKNLNKLVRSNIQVVAISDTTFATPKTVMGEKTRASADGGVLPQGTIRDWELRDDNVQDVLHLIDNGFREDQINKNLHTLLRIPIKEKDIKLQILEKATVFKVYVTDMYETSTQSVQPMEYVAYAIGCRLESGQKYTVTHKIVPHPYKGNQLVMLITNAVQANDSVSNFTLTEEVKSNLDVIRNLPGSVEDKVNLITEKVKGLIGYNGNNTLIQAIDLSYHTVLQYNFGNFQNVRGYLDTIIVGESRVGKSSTAEALRKTYGLGMFTSLAGNSATIPGLIGGSNKTAGGYQTRAGIIPQNHRGLIIFEEFGKSNNDIVKELTDIRSSNEVRITRVSGSISMPALVRMIALTNVKNTNGNIKSIASYPNGISIITELVASAEDIARYDMIVILADTGQAQINPFWEPDTPFDEETYRTRVRWVWSRTPDQVVINKDVVLYIIDKANELNDDYECHIKIFGTEAWKKVSRLAIAVAGYLVSTDDTYENLIVKKEHVDFAVNYLRKIYDNPNFKLREYVEQEKRYTTIDEDGVAALQDLYTKYTSLILQLEHSATATKNMLGACSGLNNDDLNKALNRLASGLFIKLQNHEIIPTERFRLGMAKIERKVKANRLGEF